MGERSDTNLNYKKVCQEAGKWACGTIKTHWLSIMSGGKFKQGSNGVVWLVPIYTLFGSDMVLFVCLLFHAFSSIQHCKGSPPYFRFRPIIIYLSLFARSSLCLHLCWYSWRKSSRLISLSVLCKNSRWGHSLLSDEGKPWQKVNLQEEERLRAVLHGTCCDLMRWIWLMYGARMIARQCITVSGVKTELFLSVTNVVNGEEWGVSNLLAIKAGLPSQGPSEVLSYLLDKFCERLSNGAVTGPPL